MHHVTTRLLEQITHGKEMAAVSRYGLYKHSEFSI